MQAFYPLLSLISIVVFTWLGHRMARHRNRNVWGWAVIGALLPPVLLILWVLKPLPAAEEPEADADAADFV